MKTQTLASLCISFYMLSFKCATIDFNVVGCQSNKTWQAKTWALLKLSNTNELELSVGQSLDQNVSVQNVFITMWAILGLFKILTNFSLLKFDELVTLMIPTSKPMRNLLARSTLW
jgi:hypothetical protein